MLNDPNIVLNIEYVADKSNVREYGKKFLALHNLLQIQTNEKGQRSTIPFAFNSTAMDNLITKLQPIAEKFGYELYGKVPATLNKTPNLGGILSTQIPIRISKTETITKSLSDWLGQITTLPKNKKIKWLGKSEDAIAKKVFNSIRKGVTLEEGNGNPQEYNDIISGYITFLASMMLGQEILDSLDTPLGSGGTQEGIVIDDKKISTTPYKIVGNFIADSELSPFKENVDVINEGGNAVYTNSDIKQDQVKPTVNNALKMWGLSGIPFELVGNITKPVTNDVDIAVSYDDIVKITGVQDLWTGLDEYLRTHTPVNTPTPAYKINKGLQQFHLSSPIVGEKDKFIQLDFMVGDVNWMKKHLSGAPTESEYKAKYRNILLSEIFANVIEKTDEPGVFKKYQYNSKYGVERITFTLDQSGKRIVKDKQLIFKDMDDVAKHLFGSGTSFNDINTVEKLYGKMQSSSFRYRSLLNKIASKKVQTLIQYPLLFSNR